ncbi:MAG: hypothetical protein J0L61_03465, partial [Planctomycetes bacterium]|nr:hypothetical protein [Planctomycetota bacterium]
EEAAPAFAGAVNGVAVGGRRPVIQVAFEESALSQASDIPSRLVNAGFRVLRFTEEEVNLETAFMRLTQGLVQ